MAPKNVLRCSVGGQISRETEYHNAGIRTSEPRASAVASVIIFYRLSHPLSTEIPRYQRIAVLQPRSICVHHSNRDAGAAML